MRPLLITATAVALVASMAAAANFDVNDADATLDDASTGSSAVEDCTDGLHLDLVHSQDYNHTIDDWYVTGVRVAAAGHDLDVDPVNLLDTCLDLALSVAIDDDQGANHIVLGPVVLDADTVTDGIIELPVPDDTRIPVRDAHETSALVEHDPDSGHFAGADNIAFIGAITYEPLPVTRTQLVALGATVTNYSSVGVAPADLSGFGAVVLGDTAAHDSRNPKIASYLDSGGFVFISASTGCRGPFVGNVTTVGAPTNQNTVVAPDHPLAEGLPSPWTGHSSSHCDATGVPDGATVIMKNSSTNRPTLIEYPVGAGTVLLSLQPSGHTSRHYTGQAGYGHQLHPNIVDYLVNGT